MTTIYSVSVLEILTAAGAADIYHISLSRFIQLNRFYLEGRKEGEREGGELVVDNMVNGLHLYSVMCNKKSKG